MNKLRGKTLTSGDFAGMGSSFYQEGREDEASMAGT